MALHISRESVYTSQPQTIARLSNHGSFMRGLEEATYILPTGWPVTLVEGGRIVTPGEFTRSSDGTYPLLGHGGRFGAKVGCSSTYASKGMFHRTLVNGPMNSNTFANECSLMCLGKFTANTSDMYLGGYMELSQYHEIQVFSNTSAQGGFWVRGTSASQTIAGGTKFTLQTPHLVVGRRSTAQNFHEAYVDGMLAATAACTAIGNCLPIRHSIGGLYAAGGRFGGTSTTFLQAVWSRALTVPEIKQLSGNPWQIFQYPAYPLVLDQAAAAAVDLPRYPYTVQQAVNRASTF